MQAHFQAPRSHSTKKGRSWPTARAFASVASSYALLIPPLVIPSAEQVVDQGLAVGARLVRLGLGSAEVLQT